jgi:hypothetical protein
MKTYKLYYSNECNPIDVFEIKRFLKKNKLDSQVMPYLYLNGNDAIQQMTHLNSVFDRQLAEQSVVLPVKLRYFLLVEEDINDIRQTKFVKDKDNIIAYLQSNLL